ncbi:MAG: hypothetical protein U0T36_07330 [Saprospiraceae bacterium]
MKNKIFLVLLAFLTLVQCTDLEVKPKRIPLAKTPFFNHQMHTVRTLPNCMEVTQLLDRTGHMVLVIYP